MTRLQPAELFVVPAERHVERLARDGGHRGETRIALRARLAAALLPEVRFADARETRLTLGIALSAPAQGQLDLFGGAGADEDPLLATLRSRGGGAWVRAVAALDEALGVLRSRGATDAHLDRIRGPNVSAPSARRARLLATAMRALDATLARAGARDGRLVGASLASTIRAKGWEDVSTILGARRICARWLLSWDPNDLTWWRALDDTLSHGGGYAKVILPSFDKRLEGSRERDPLEVLADVVARQLDAAPDTETVPDVLGGANVDPSRVRLAQAGSSRAQAQLVARCVRDALARGAHVERIAIAYPVREERTLDPLRRTFFEEGIVFHDSLGAPPATVPVVAAALHALAASESLDRLAVARVLRSGYVDAPRVLSDDSRLDFRGAERTLERLAHALETRATAAGADAERRLVLTAASGGGPDEEAAALRVAGILARPRVARTRLERVRTTRALFHELGFAARAGRGALVTFARDDAPSGVDRAERLALARDVRAWELLEEELDAYEEAIQRAGAAEAPLDAEVFRLELLEMLDRSARRPNAGRAGAVRITRLADLAGEELDLLVVLDVNDGVLPRDQSPVGLVSDALEVAVARAARETFVPFKTSELAARDLGALAIAAAESDQIVLVTTAEEGTDSPAAPSRLFLALERAGATTTTSAGTEGANRSRAGTSELCSPGEVARRTTRERTREGFFLDPLRPQSDIIGMLRTSHAITEVVERETGADSARALAVTSIERFAQCPFKGYAHAVLAARTGEEQRELPDAREEGNLGHTALAAAFLATRDAWAVRPRDAVSILERGLAAADTLLAVAAGHAPLRAIVRLRVKESVRAVLRRAIDDESWDFVLAEQAFGSRRRGDLQPMWEAFQVEGAQTRVWLRGSIDRVDRGHSVPEVRVVDYKRSKSTVQRASSSLGETALQVPIYALVAARHLELRATGSYLPIVPRDLATETKPRTTAEDRVRELVGGSPSVIEQRLVTLAARARAGDFAPLPAHELECTHCDISGGCRKPRFAMAPADDPEAV